MFEQNESALSRLLKLEKENQGLQSHVEELREASLSLDQAQLRAQALEKENGQLNEKVTRPYEPFSKPSSGGGGAGSLSNCTKRSSASRGCRKETARS